MLQAVVTNAFADYPRGTVITDPKLISDIRSSENAVNIVVRQAPAQQSAEPIDRLAPTPVR